MSEEGKWQITQRVMLQARQQPWLRRAALSLGYVHAL